MLCYLLLYLWGYSSVAQLVISKQGYIIMLCYLLPYSWGYSSVVEHSTADREDPGSNPIFQHCTFVHK